MKFPKMVHIEQIFKNSPIKDISTAISTEFTKINPQKIISKGQSVAITAGSRGISNIDVIIKEIVRELKQIGAVPFIIPAMGSHGGAESGGQKKILEKYGITPTNVGAPIKSSMQVVHICTSKNGIPVYIDKYAVEADHIVAVNRVKPHTDFKGKNESGLMKILAIGLGKQKGASIYHNAMVRSGHSSVLMEVAREILKRCPVAFGLAVVENQRDETQIIQAIPADEIETAEQLLLKKASKLFPTIPFDPIDVLIVDQMGKEISGTGMDQNVIGRSVVPYHTTLTKPDIMRIFVRDLTPDSDGNAIGIGNADFTTKRLVDKIDLNTTYMNAMTSSCPEAARIPIYYRTDKEAISAALMTIGSVEPRNTRVIHIHDTSHLDKMYISESLLKEARKKKGIKIIDPSRRLKFSKEGALISNL